MALNGEVRARALHRPRRDAAHAARLSDGHPARAELREELARVSAQFENYRAAVQRTLDQRWGVNEGFDDEDRTADVAGVVRRETGKPKGKDANPNDESKYYWESYSGVGKCLPPLLAH